MKKQLKVLSLAIVLVLVAVFSPLGTDVAMAAELSKYNYEIATRETEGMVIGKIGAGYDKVANYCDWELVQGNVNYNGRSDSAANISPKGDGWTGNVSLKRTWYNDVFQSWFNPTVETFNVNVYDTTTLCFKFKREGDTFRDGDKFTRSLSVNGDIDAQITEVNGTLGTYINNNITPTEGEYTFDGNWYEDEACTVPVDKANFWKKSSRNYYGIIKKAETQPEVETTLEVTYAEDKTYEYNGAEHVYDGNVTVQVDGVDTTEGVTLEYKEGEGEWTTELPKITDIGRKNLLVRAKYDGATSSEHGFFMEVTERQPVVSTANVTFKIVNGTWDGTDSADKTVIVTLTDGKGTLDASQIPAGMTASEGYDNNSGAWNAEISSQVTGNATYSYTFEPQQQEQEQNPPIIIPYTPVVIEDDETPLEEEIQNEEVIDDEETPLAEEGIEDEETPLAEAVIDDEAAPLAETTDVPKTGDASNIPMWIALLFVSVLGFAGTAYSAKRKEK